MGEAIPRGSPVYIRYLDHVLFRNTPEALENATERETIGWLTQETGELLCIQHDRTIESLQYASGKASGLVLLKSCILEIRELPLQNTSRWPLISRNDIITKLNLRFRARSEKFSRSKQTRDGANQCKRSP